MNPDWMDRMDDSWHEAWHHEYNFTETQRCQLDHYIDNDDEGVYVSFDYDNNVIRTGVVSHVIDKVRQLIHFPNEVKWEIYIPRRTGKDGVRDMKCPKQQIKRANKGQKW